MTERQTRMVEAESFEAGYAEGRASMTDEERLGFHIEVRGDVAVVVFDEGGVSPATSVAESLWAALEAFEKRVAMKDAEIERLREALNLVAIFPDDGPLNCDECEARIKVAEEALAHPAREEK